jgi:chemotaxis signal transduction protein
VIKNIHLLLFSVHHLLFGIYAEQVEELLEDSVLSKQERTSTEYTIPYKGQHIRVINFSRWIDEEQKASAEKRGTRNEEHCESHRTNVVSEFRKHEDISISSPKILIIRRQEGGYTGVRIDNLEDLITLSIEQVHSLPMIMQRTKRIQGLWGIALVKDCPVILIDLAQL